MEKVAIKYWGTPSEKFVSNYIIAHVYSATNEGVFVIAKSGIRMFVLKESVIKLEEFLEIRRNLKDKGKIVDPSIGSRASMKQKLAVTETLDDIIARGDVDIDDLDSDIKRKLNPKRINNAMATDIINKRQSEISMSTVSKKKNKTIVVEEEPEKPSKKKKVTEPEVVEKPKSSFSQLKQKMNANKKRLGGKR